MQISNRCITLIKKHEGLSLNAYTCPAGLRTIGYGHVTSELRSVTEEQANELLMDDIDRACLSVRRLIKVELTQGQIDALTSFVFNLGGGALQRSRLRACINRSEYDVAADEFLRWVYVNGRKSHGLMKRRKCERDLFLS